jgi:hypothetical protein
MSTVVEADEVVATGDDEIRKSKGEIENKRGRAVLGRGEIGR